MPPHHDLKGRPIVAVSVTGMGIITSLGRGKDGNWRDLTAGRSGVRRIPALPRGRPLAPPIAGAV
jgi:3-oxoacyl-[acyl-carrier-protein] synthase II